MLALTSQENTINSLSYQLKVLDIIPNSLTNFNSLGRQACKCMSESSKMSSARLGQLAGQLAAAVADARTSANIASSYKVLEQPLGTARPIRIVGIGAGMSGMNMIRTLRLHLTDYEHVVYEKNPKIGGTWFENRYPGCKCDIPSHNYQFSWRPNPEWSAFFSPAEEIEDYLYRVCEEEKMHDHIMLEHQVTRAEWDETGGVWHLKVTNLRTNTAIDDYCHFLLDSCGILKYVSPLGSAVVPDL